MDNLIGCALACAAALCEFKIGAPARTLSCERHTAVPADTQKAFVLASQAVRVWTVLFAFNCVQQTIATGLFRVNF
jgi:hypothetical protein